MKYIKKYENKDQEFKIGDYVKLTDRIIYSTMNKIRNTDKYKYSGSIRNLTAKDLKSKILIITDYSDDINDDDLFLHYNTSNIDEDDDFEWGWTVGENLRHLTKEETEVANIIINSKKYNI